MLIEQRCEWHNWLHPRMLRRKQNGEAIALDIFQQASCNI